MCLAQLSLVLPPQVLYGNSAVVLEVQQPQRELQAERVRRLHLEVELQEDVLVQVRAAQCTRSTSQAH